MAPFSATKKADSLVASSRVTADRAPTRGMSRAASCRAAPGAGACAGGRRGPRAGRSAEPGCSCAGRHGGRPASRAGRCGSTPEPAPPRPRRPGAPRSGPGDVPLPPLRLVAIAPAPEGAFRNALCRLALARPPPLRTSSVPVPAVVASWKRSKTGQIIWYMDRTYRLLLTLLLAALDPGVDRGTDTVGPRSVHEKPADPS